jgi:hypothetical protein
MKKLFLLSVSAFLFFGTGLSARAQADDHPFAGAPTQYSVAVVTAQKTGAALTMWVYVDEKRRRTEQETNSGRLVLILRGDLNLMYTIIVSRKAYRVAPLDPSLLESLGTYEAAKDMMLSHEKVGTETVKGEVCDKYHFWSPTDKNKSAHRSEGPTSGYIWISQSTHFPVMSKTEGATTNWENLEIGPQDPSLFQPPADYKRID